MFVFWILAQFFLRSRSHRNNISFYTEVKSTLKRTVKNKIVKPVVLSKKVHYCDKINFL